MPFVSILVALVLGEAAAAPQAKLVQEIVVTAAREEQPRDQAAAAVTVLNRETIERLPAQTLSEVLGYVPGVTMMFDSGASGGAMVTSRGFFGGGEVEYVKLLVDGVPVGDAESGNVDWQRFRTAGVERIEVLHGPGSALYGDAALGGVIQVFTRAPEPQVYVSAGSFGARELQVSGGVELRSGLQLSATAGTWENGGFREHAETDDRLLHVSLERAADRSRWRFSADGDRQDRHQPGPLTRAEIAADREQSNALFRSDRQTTTRGRIDGTYESFGAVPLRATLYAADRDDDNLRTILLAPGFGISALRALTTHTRGGSFEASREWTRLTLRAGTDLERASIVNEYEGLTPEQRGSRTRAALFVTGGWALSDRIRLSAGLRRDEIHDDMTVNRTASAWSPRAGVNIHLRNGSALFVQASEAFKAPTLDQLFDPRPFPDGQGGTFTISSVTLRPQRARNLEAGLSRSTASHEWSVVAYRLSVRDEIDFDPRTFSYRNIGRSLHRGVEASAAFAKNARLSPRLTYAWTSVADAEAPGVQLKNIPEHAAQLLLHARLTERTNGDVVYRWRGSLTLDDDGAFRTPSVSRVDLRVSHDIGNVRLHADVLNAMDAQYNELGFVLADFLGRPVALEFPAPGRSARLGITWTLQRGRNR